jgi:drug/metabolite transporter (DMT)-like permease
VSPPPRGAIAERAAPHERATSADAFAPLDWALVTGVALAWGASFLFIELGLDHFEPGLVAFLRVFFGAATLALIPGARRAVPRSEWPRIALLGVVWMTVPFMLFAVAQQWIDSSLAGMINAAAPLFTALIAAIAVRHLPGRIQAAGLVVGFLGVVAITSPSLGQGESSTLGILLVLLATVLYGCAFNLAGPLQRRNGALPVIWRAQLVALVFLTPLGAAGAAGSSFEWSSLAAMIALGSIGTALGFVWFATLAGRVGPTRGSLTIYFIPVVAIVLGALLLDESIHAAAILGTALVIAGAYLTSRQERMRQPRAAPRLRGPRPGCRSSQAAPSCRRGWSTPCRRAARPPRRFPCLEPRDEPPRRPCRPRRRCTPAARA